MKKMLAALLISLMAMPFAFTGCAPKIGANDYTADGTGSVQSVQYGTVKSVRKVNVENDKGWGTALGTTGGGVVGGVLGSLIGGGTGRTLATVGGAVLGAATGYGGGKLMNQQEGYEVTVQLENGQTVAITQGTDVSFASGQRVRVMSGGKERARVLPDQ